MGCISSKAPVGKRCFLLLFHLLSLDARCREPGVVLAFPFLFFLSLLQPFREAVAECEVLVVAQHAVPETRHAV